MALSDANQDRIRKTLSPEIEAGNGPKIAQHLPTVVENLYDRLPSGDYGRGDVRDFVLTLIDAGTGEEEAKPEPVRISVTIELDSETLGDLVCAGLECGTLATFRIESATLNASDVLDYQGLAEGRATWVLSFEDWEEVERFELTRAKLVKGLEILQDRYPHHVADIHEERSDALTGDALLQCALFGSIVVG